MNDIPADVLEKLSAAGWVWISARTSPNGLRLHTFGRWPETGMGGTLRRYEETEERSVDGWIWEASLDAR
jgi:hypothetical protein